MFSNKRRLCFCVLIGYFAFVHGGLDGEFPFQRTKHAPPRILNHGEDFTINSRENVSLECEGTNRVTWMYLNNTLDGTYWSDILVYGSDVSGTMYRYRSRLTIRNASFADTGFYYCHEEDNNYDDPFTSTRIYIYVRDEHHLHMEVPNIFLEPEINSEIILPCRPTDPDIKVTLTKSGSDDIKASYDPMIGFSVRVDYLSDSGDYTCTFTKGNKIATQNIFLRVVQKPTHIEKPVIISPNYSSIGVHFLMECKVRIKRGVNFDLTWTVPDKEGLKTGRIVSSNITRIEEDSGEEEIGMRFLNITHTLMSDDGTYTCTVVDHVNNSNEASKNIKIFGELEEFISLAEESGTHSIEVTAGEDDNVQWIIKVEAHPKRHVTWINNRNHSYEVMHELQITKYYAKLDAETTMFRINDVNLEDTGTYTVKVTNGYSEKSLPLNLTVRDYPKVTIISSNYHLLGKESSLNCSVDGYPLPDINWYFKPCFNASCSFQEMKSTRLVTGDKSWRIVSILTLLANQSGLVKCEASNEEGTGSSSLGFYVTDNHNLKQKGFNIWGVDMKETEGKVISTIAAGTNIELHCGASVHNYTQDLQWVRKFNETVQDEEIIKNSKRYTILKEQMPLSHMATLKITSISKTDSGVYVCNTFNKESDRPDAHMLRIVVLDPRKPIITYFKLNNDRLSVPVGHQVRLECKADGLPEPTLTWTKDGKDWTRAINYTNATISDDNTVLSFTAMLNSDGEYTCRASNTLGSAEKTLNLEVLGTKTTDYKTLGIWIGIVCALAGIVVVSVCCFYRRTKRNFHDQMRKAGLTNFENGALDSLNPELGVDDQAELLPYDKKWEFPRDKLKLGKQLGSGAFGVVMKAEALGISEGEAVSTVAVKMVKRNADYIYIKALSSELKIMVHLGKNLNVVNLLGACTKNICKRELMVIVEYCQYGNLHNYLFRHRDNFINQIDPKSGRIDRNIGTEILSRSLSISSYQSSQTRSTSGSVGNARKPCAGVDYRDTPNPTTNDTEITVCMSPCPTTAGEINYITNSNGTAQPEWRSNYRGDYNKRNVKPICSSDLLCWAFQVARGMDYLASRKVLHGDLAARNILLAEDNIVKICDFGLAKSMYKSDNYKKKGDGPLPIKWMAIESIRDRVFSTQSDVWSYGIVLWEFFSLARTPYPGMEADERLFHKLVDGYRMDQPEFATKELYQIMMACWCVKPAMRPSFTELAENLGGMLSESVKNHYIDLNNPYIAMNNQMFNDDHRDYLMMLNAPDYQNLASPQIPHDYVNDCVPIQDTDESAGSASGYLDMRVPKDIFSPRPSSAEAFQFQLGKRSKSKDEIATGMELQPMLSTSLDSPPTSPTLAPTSYVNPSYQKGLNFQDQPAVPEVKTLDNYVNMPQHKELVKNDIKCLAELVAPEYNKEKENTVIDATSGPNYVNNNSRDWERLHPQVGWSAS